MTLFVKRVLRISALWFISQIHEKAILVNYNKNVKNTIEETRLTAFSLYQIEWYIASHNAVCCASVYVCAHRSTLERREQRLELSSSGTMSIL